MYYVPSAIIHAVAVTYAHFLSLMMIISPMLLHLLFDVELYAKI